MLKLCLMTMLGAFMIYGLDEMKVISADNFQIIEEPTSSKDKLSNNSHKKTSKFTNRIVKLRQQQKEG